MPSAVVERSVNTLDQAQTVKAVKALQAHLASKKESSTGKQNLLEGDSDDEDAEEFSGAGAADPDMALWLQVTTKKFITDQKRLKPSKIVLKNPIITLSPTLTICLIVKDPSTSFKSLVPSLNLPSTSTLKITTPTKLRTKFKSYESRRQLERAHDVFLADDRVAPMLPAILGKSIYSRSAKIPIPVNISGKESSPAAFKKEIEKALAATYFNLSPSDCHAVKVGTRTMSADKVAENVDTVVAKLVEKYIPKGWEGLKGLHIKSAESAALPIWLTDKIYNAQEDVLTAEEVKALEHAKTPEGIKERKDGKKERRKEKKTQWMEKQKNKRNWDSDDEEVEEKKEEKKEKAEVKALRETPAVEVVDPPVPAAVEKTVKKQKVSKTTATTTKSSGGDKKKKVAKK